MIGERENTKGFAGKTCIFKKKILNQIIKNSAKQQTGHIPEIKYRFAEPSSRSLQLRHRRAFDPPLYRRSGRGRRWGILHSEMSARVKKIGAVIKTLSEKKMVNARPHAGHRLSDVFLPHINDLL